MAGKFDIRKQYGPNFLPPGDLLAIQRDSFEHFLQKNVLADERLNCGLQALLKYFFPIKSLDGSFALDIVSYEIDLPARKVDECRQKKLTYGANVKGLFRLFAYDKDGSIIDVREQPAPFFFIPLLTSDGTFIVNGVEKVVLSQIVRAPGAVFAKSQDGRCVAKILPDWGAWIRYEFNKAGALYTRIDLSPPFPLLHLFNAFECSAEEIWQYFSPSLRKKLLA